MNRYVADLHFSHENIISFDGRPFADVDEMDNTLIKNWNHAVEPGDTTYILGDFCWDKEPRWIEVLKQLKGNKVLIRGNHDLSKMSRECRNLFQDVKDYKEVDDGGYKLRLCHYPMMFYNKAYNVSSYMLCGHVHITRENELLEKWRDEMWADLNNTLKRSGASYGQIINVGCMMPYMNYKPKTFKEILQGFSKYQTQRMA